MKIKMLPVFTFLLVLNLESTPSFAQKNHKTILAHIDAAIQTMPKQKTFVYSWVSWCGANKEDAMLLDSVLLTRNKCYNFILLVNGEVDRAILPAGFKKADSIISYDPYFITGFRKRKEPKVFAKQFNKYYQTEEAYLLGPGTAFLLNADRTLISKYRWTYKEITDNLLKDCP